MRILFLGDVNGRSGRDAVAKHLPGLKASLKPDFTILNVENAAGGFGVTKAIANEFLSLGADCMTTGNHIWDQQDIIPYMAQEKRLLRPLNFPAGTVGHGAYEAVTPNGSKLVVVNLMARLFMDPLDCPFVKMDEFLKPYKLGANVQGIFVDFHGEATSEKMALAHYLDGRVSAVIGTHTHIPTADLQIFGGGTAYQSDAGMCGDFDSVIGMQKDIPIAKFVRKVRTEKMTSALGEGTVCGTLLDIHEATGRTTKAQQIILGPRLENRTAE